MARITIPFKDQFGKRMLDGVKVCTWRTKKYGEEGDIFQAFGASFKIHRVTKEKMITVVLNWEAEGFDSAQQAGEFMEKLRPKTGFNPDLIGWHLWFHKIEVVQKGDG